MEVNPQAAHYNPNIIFLEAYSNSTEFKRKLNSNVKLCLQADKPQMGSHLLVFLEDLCPTHTELSFISIYRNGKI